VRCLRERLQRSRCAARYHPSSGILAELPGGVRFGQARRCPHGTRRVRWAGQTLKPKATPVDVEVVRRTLIDHLADRVSPWRPGAFLLSSCGSESPARTARLNAMSRPPGCGGRPPNASAFDPVDLAKWAKTVGVDLDPYGSRAGAVAEDHHGFLRQNVRGCGPVAAGSDRGSEPARSKDEETRA